MVIIKIMGGLGNQMFQAALYKSMEIEGKEVKADLTHIQKYGNNHNGYELKRIFGLNLVEASENEINKYADLQLTLWGRVKRKIGGIRKATHYLEQTYEYKPEILELNTIYLEGYWQTEKYFKNIRSEILKMFTFPNIVGEKNKECLSEVSNSESVAVHIRRGDYLTGDNLDNYGNICTKDYYNSAIDYIRNHVSNPFFYVFSDEIEWVQENFDFGNVRLVNWNSGNNSFLDMQLMSLCKHQIIANSTFSWWAAWLNQNPDKLVIMPAKWMNHIENPDIGCEGWIRLGADG